MRRRHADNTVGRTASYLATSLAAARTLQRRTTSIKTEDQ